MTGDICLQKLRQSEKHANINVIVLTNMNSEKILKKMESLIIDGFILKSEMTPKQVLEKVKSSLSKHPKHKK
jgi:DNA-binding NarL/FixJ family response regulator